MTCCRCQKVAITHPQAVCQTPSNKKNRVRCVVRRSCTDRRNSRGVCEWLQITVIILVTGESSGEGSVLSKAQIKPNPPPTTTFDGPMERWRCQTYSTSWAIHCDLKWANQSNTIFLSLQRSLTKCFILV